MAHSLVIGGTLFLGRALVEQLLDRGDEVVIMHRGQGTPFGDRVSEIRCDRNDTAAVTAALQYERFDYVFDNVYDWQRGTSAEQVVAAALATAPGLRRYVFTSSVAVYGEGYDRSETEPLVPSDYPNRYGAQKANSERALFELNRTQNIPVTTLRPAFIYGPHNPYDREAFFWDRIRADRPVIVPGDGSSPMMWVHVRDVARAALVASQAEAAVAHAYNLASPPIAQIDFVRLLARVAGKPVQVVPVPREQIQRAGGKLVEPPLYFGAFLDLPPLTVPADRVRQELGFVLTPLEEGLRDAYAWYLQQERPKPDFAWEDRLLENLLRSN